MKQGSIEDRRARSGARAALILAICALALPFTAGALFVITLLSAMPHQRP